MLVYKDKGIKYSQYILEEISTLEICGKGLYCRTETFYNCREQGYVFEIHSNDYEKNMLIWVYAHRNSDEPTMVYELDKCLPSEGANMFTQDAWENRQYTYNTIEKLSDKVKEVILDYFKEEEEEK